MRTPAPSFVSVESDGSRLVYNAPIIATGEGPFDVTTHTNTHDRTLGIDTEAMTTDRLFVRGFANGESILYLSFDSSDAFTATIERSTFVPALADLAFQNGGGLADSARASIFTFVNAQTGLEDSPPERGASQGPGRSQGLTHALSLDIAGPTLPLPIPTFSRRCERAPTSATSSTSFRRTHQRPTGPSTAPHGICSSASTATKRCRTD